MLLVQKTKILIRESSPILSSHLMCDSKPLKSRGGSRIFNWGGPRIDRAREDCKNVALFPLKS